MFRTTAARFAGAALTLVLLFHLFAGCGAARPEESRLPEESSSSLLSSASETTSSSSSSEDPAESMVSVELLGDTGEADGTGVTIEGNRIVVTRGGVYQISGALFDGQLIVEAGERETVRLILNGVNVYCSDSSPLLVRSAGETILTLADNSANMLADANAQRAPEDWGTPEAAVYCRGDLIVQGNGTLQIDAPYQNGMQSEGTLRIAGGVLKVNAADVGIRGRDAIQVSNAILTVQAGGDGLQADNSEADDKGSVLVESGNLTLTTGGDGIQAGTSLRFNNGSCAIRAGGGCEAIGRYTDDWTDEGSAKGLKAGTDLTITGGRFEIDAADDALHSKGTIQLSGGALQLRSAADGIHADHSLLIRSGAVSVLQALEGLKSASVGISGGTIAVHAQDSGVIASGSSAGSQAGPEPDGQPADSDGSLRIEGGLLVVNAQGDGLVAAGAHMTGGTVLVNGPDRPDPAASDGGAAFRLDGGTLIAAGAAGRMRAVSEDSAQDALVLTLPEQPAGTLVHLETAEGKTLLTYAPSSAYSSVVLSLPTLERDVSYLLYVGGSANGMVSDGVYTGGSYTGGARVAAFQITERVTDLHAQS